MKKLKFSRDLSVKIKRLEAAKEKHLKAAEKASSLKEEVDKIERSILLNFEGLDISEKTELAKRLGTGLKWLYLKHHQIKDSSCG